MLLHLAKAAVAHDSQALRENLRKDLITDSAQRPDCWGRRDQN
jgi:hypothetical protein